MHRPVIVAVGATATTIVAASVAHGRVDGLRAPLQGHRADSVKAALPTLREAGIVVVENALDDALISAIEATSAFQDMPRRVERSRGRGLGTRREARPDWVPSAVGRLHRREETLSNDDVRTLERIEALVKPLVREFFQDDDFYRSELQLLNAMPRGESQAWHADNIQRGFGPERRVRGAGVAATP